MADSSSVSLCGAVRLVSMVFQVSGCVAERGVLFGGVVCFVACLRLLFVRVLVFSCTYKASTLKDGK